MRAVNAVWLVAALLSGVIGYRLGQAGDAPPLGPAAMEQDSQGAVPVQASSARALSAGLTDEERSIIGVARQVSPAVVSVLRPDGSGSGVMIRSDGILLTNAHVVGSFERVRVPALGPWVRANRLSREDHASAVGGGEAPDVRCETHTRS